MSFNTFLIKLKKIILLIIIIIIKYLENFNLIKLLDHHKINNKYIISREKKKLLSYLSKKMKNNITKIDTIFLNYTAKFGNQIILLNKAIFYCEILKCKRIFVNKCYLKFI